MTNFTGLHPGYSAPKMAGFGTGRPSHERPRLAAKSQTPPLALEPVWPSRLRHDIHELAASSERTLRFADVAALVPPGVDGARYESFDYGATQALAAAAHFLEFDGLLVPSARHGSANLVLFMDRVVPGSIEVRSTEPVD